MAIDLTRLSSVYDPVSQQVTPLPARPVLGQAAAQPPQIADQPRNPVQVAPAPSGDLERLIDEEGAQQHAPVIRAIYGQESGSGANTKTSVDGAEGGMQVIPGTFKRMMPQGDPSNPTDQLRAGVRYVKLLADKAGGDPAKIAAGYFSGDGNINTGEGTPYLRHTKDGTGKSVSSYVSDVLKRIDTAAAQSPGGAEPVTWQAVTADTDYQQLDAAGKEEVRQRYFRNVVLPATPTDQIGAVKVLFDERTAPSWTKDALRVGKDLMTDAASQVVGTIGGSMLRGAGLVLQVPSPEERRLLLSDDPEQRAAGQKLKAGREGSVGNAIGAWISSRGENAQAFGRMMREQGMSERGQDEMAKPALEGNILEGQWPTINPQASAETFAHAILGLLGGLAPILGGAAIAGPGGATVMGGLQMAGQAQESADARTDEQMRQSPAYQGMVKSGVSAPDALRDTRTLVTQAAGGAGAVAGALGGGALSGVYSKAGGKWLMDRITGTAARVAARGATGAAGGAAFMVGQGVGTNVAMNQAAGSELVPPGEGSGQNLVMGATLGGLAALAHGGGQKAGAKPGPLPAEDVLGQTASDAAGRPVGDAPPALPAPVIRPDNWEVVDGQQVLAGPNRAQPPAAPNLPRLPAPDGPAPIMVDTAGNATTQPAVARAEAITRQTEHDQRVAAERAGYQAQRAQQAEMGLTPDVLNAQLQRSLGSVESTPGESHEQSAQPSRAAQQPAGQPGAGEPAGSVQPAGSAPGAGEGAGGRQGDNRSPSAGRDDAQPAEVRNANQDGIAGAARKPSPLSGRQPVNPDANPVTVTGLHYTNKAGIDALDPAMGGSSTPGGEQLRVQGTRLRNRTYFYVKDGQELPVGEAIVRGRNAYEAQVGNLYDQANHPDPVVVRLAREHVVNGEDPLNAFESAVIDAGYDGYVANHPVAGKPQRAAVVLDTKPIPVRALVRAEAPQARPPDRSWAVVQTPVAPKPEPPRAEAPKPRAGPAAAEAPNEAGPEAPKPQPPKPEAANAQPHPLVGNLVSLRHKGKTIQGRVTGVENGRAQIDLGESPAGDPGGRATIGGVPLSRLRRSGLDTHEMAQPEAGATIDEAQAAHVVDSFRREFKGAGKLDINVVRSESDVPAGSEVSGKSGRKEAWYDRKTGRITVVLDNLLDAPRLAEVLAHEIVGHHGIESLVRGPAFQSLLDDVHKAMHASGELGVGENGQVGIGARNYATVEAVRKLYPEAGDNEVAMEVLARLAEMGRKPGFVDRLVTLVRQAMRPIMRMAGREAPMSKAEILGVVEAAREHVKQGRNELLPPEEADRMGQTQASSRSAYEVAPDPNDKVATDKWNAKTVQERVDKTYSIDTEAFPLVAKALGLANDALRAVKTFGGYMGQTNPSVVRVSDSVPDADIRRVSAAIGFVYNQDSVLALVGKPTDTSMTGGILHVELDRQMDEPLARAIYDAIRNAPGNEWVQGFTGYGDRFDIINVGGDVTQPMMDAVNEALRSATIDAVIGTKIGDPVNVEFVERGSYGDSSSAQAGGVHEAGAAERLDPGSPGGAGEGAGPAGLESARQLVSRRLAESRSSGWRDDAFARVHDEDLDAEPGKPDKLTDEKKAGLQDELSAAQEQDGSKHRAAVQGVSADKVKAMGAYAEDAFARIEHYGPVSDRYGGTIEEAEVWLGVGYGVAQVSDMGRGRWAAYPPKLNGGGAALSFSRLSEVAAKAYNRRIVASAELVQRGFDLLSSAPGGAVGNVVKVWRRVAQIPGAFEYRVGLDEPVGANSVERMNDLAKQLLHGSGVEIEVGPPKSGGRRFPITLTDIAGVPHFAELEFKGDRDSGSFVVHADELDRGSSMGKPLYQFAAAVADYMGKPINADPSGLLGVNTYRRTEQMLSAAARLGRAGPMRPGIGQRIYGWDGSPKSAKAGERNFARIALASMRNAGEIVPEFRPGEITYDLAGDRFSRRGEDVEGLIGDILKRPDVRSTSISRSTLARAAITAQALAGKDPTASVGDVGKAVLYSKAPGARKVTAGEAAKPGRDPQRLLDEGLDVGPILGDVAKAAVAGSRIPTVAGRIVQRMRDWTRKLDSVNDASMQDQQIDIGKRAVAEALQGIQGRTDTPSFPVPIGHTPHALRMAGFPMQMMRIDSSVVRKVLLDKHGDEFSGVSPADFVQAIYRPMMVLKDASPETLRVVSPLISRQTGLPITFMLRRDTSFDARDNMPSGKTLAVTSAYSKASMWAPGEIERAIGDRSLIYADYGQLEAAQKKNPALGRALSLDVATGSRWEDAGSGSPRLAPGSSSLDLNGTASSVSPGAASTGRAQTGDAKSIPSMTAKKPSTLDNIKAATNTGMVNGYGDLVKFIADEHRGPGAEMPAFSRSPGGRDEAGPGFYSALRREIGGVSDRALTNVGWSGVLRSLLNKGAIKAGEVQWSGISDWLDMQQGKVTKEQVQQFLDGNGVRVEETIFSRDGKPNNDEWEPDDGRIGNTKYGKYTLPGGENYREVLLTLPHKSPSVAAAGWTAKLLMQKSPVTGNPEFEVRDADDRFVNIARSSSDAQSAINSVALWALRRRQSDGDYKSKHWGQPNVLAHIRLEDRIDADGKKVLFVEELQSDWAQDGRQNGFDTGELRRLRDEKKALYDSVMSPDAPGEPTSEQKRRWVGLQDAILKLDREPRPTAAPFVTKTDAWVSLAMKRIVKMAVDGGYDKVAFINGEQSAARYDLSKQVDSIHVWADPGGGYYFKAEKDGRHVASSDSHGGGPITERALAETIGKELADRAVRQVAESHEVKFTGDDLRVGGAGMKAFYDKIVPAVAKDVVRKLGGAELETVDFAGRLQVQRDNARGGWMVYDPATKTYWRGGNSDRLWVDYPQNAKVYLSEAAARRQAKEERRDSPLIAGQPGFAITDGMRAQAAGGVPLFSRAPGERDYSSGPLDWLIKKAGATLVRDWVTKPAGELFDKLVDKAIPERVRMGIESDFGLDEPYLDRRLDRDIEIHKTLRRATKTLDGLAGLTRDESKVAYLWMNEAPDTRLEAELMDRLPPQSRERLREMKRTLDELGQAAVEAGLLSQDSYERNKMAYLHRSYLEHEALKSKGGSMSSQNAASVRADTYKGRGLRDDVSDERLVQLNDEVKEGDKLLRIERRRADGKLAQADYIRPDAPIPAGYTPEHLWEVRWMGGPDSTKVGMWRDMTPAERQHLGEIDEVRFAFAKTVMSAARDIENQKFLKWIADTYGRESVPEDKIAKGEDSYLTTKAYKLDEFVKVPDTTIAGTKLKKYGDAAGKLIPAVVWNDIRNQMAVPESEMAQWFHGLTRAWKISKTALSPAVHTNNVMSNFVMADLADLGVHDVVGALSTIIKAKAGNAEAKAMLERYEDSGAELGSMAARELNTKFIEPLLKELEAQQAQELGMTRLSQIVNLAAHGKVSDAMKALLARKDARIAALPFKLLIDAYQAEDSVFRLAKFTKEVAAGKADRDAGTAARQAFLDYNINAPWIQTLRKSGMPFIAFSYRAIPLIAKALRDKPWKLAKYIGTAAALNAATYAMLGMSGEQADQERKRHLPKELQGNIWGVFPRALRMPWNDARSQPVFLDVRRWIPAGDVFDLQGNHSALPLPNWLQAAGPLSLFAELMLNKDSFTGKPIIQDTDTKGEMVAKEADKLFKWLAPNLPLPGPGYLIPGLDKGQMQTYAWQSIIDAGSGKTDPFGREQSLPQAVASAFGVKEKTYPEDTARLRIVQELAAANNEVKGNINAIVREYARHGITKAELDERMAREMAKLKKSGEQAQEALH